LAEASTRQLGSAYRALALAQLRSQLQYRVSFAIDLAGSVLFGAIDLVAVVVMYRVARTLGGFTFRETWLMATLAASGFSAADLVVGNIERMRGYVRTGQLDAILVRPLSALAQLIAGDLAPRRLGRAVFSVAMLAVAVPAADVRLTPANLLLLVITPLSGAVVFGALFVATATVAFWWIESNEFANGLTYGGRDFTAYPITVYSGLFRRVFAYGFGFAFVGYYPALALLGRADPLGAPVWLGWCSPLVALAAATLSGLAWRTGIRHYRSTGS
jgi:ABC-2 type transport system permease protein